MVKLSALCKRNVLLKEKNETGFPANAVKYIVDKFELSNDNIDIVAMSSIERTALNHLKYPIDAVFDVKDHIDMMNDYWKPKLAGQDYPKKTTSSKCSKKSSRIKKLLQYS
ncbi:hypothetical protein QW180_08795 [Vibrio sinaloensis]|nr:hypothetical protein [Vibrio sinaloensis]